MKPLTAEWIRIAEGDFHSARRALRARKNPNYDDACFHARESAEKYLQGCVVQASIQSRKTHDLHRLVKLLLPSRPNLESLRPSLSNLNQYTDDILYPGRKADRTQAKEAFAHCREVRRALRTALGLPAK